MIRYVPILILLAFSFLTSPLWAHGDNQHVLGTVIETADNHVVVKTPKGQSVSIAFRAETSFQQNGISKKEARPQVGDRVAAEVTKNGVQEGEDWVATEVRFATPKSK